MVKKIFLLVLILNVFEHVLYFCVGGKTFKELTKNMLVVAQVEHCSLLLGLSQQNAALLTCLSNFEKQIILSMCGTNVQDVFGFLLSKVFLDLFIARVFHHFPDGDHHWRVCGKALYAHFERCLSSSVSLKHHLLHLRIRMPKKIDKGRFEITCYEELKKVLV